MVVVVTVVVVEVGIVEEKPYVGFTSERWVSATAEVRNKPHVVSREKVLAV